MKTQPKVSVIVPVYNTEAYLNECLSSVANQTFSNIEIICVDDGSSDSSLEIIKAFIQKDKRFILVNSEHKGAANARNIAMKIAKGEYLYFLDSDDFITENCLESLYNKAIETDADVVICGSQSLHVNTKAISRLDFALKLNLLPLDKKFFSCLDIKNYAFQFFNGWPWDKLYKHSFINKHKLKYQNVRSTNDLFFVNSAVILAQRISIVSDVLITHRIGDKNSLENTRYKDPFCFLAAIDKFVNFLRKKNLFKLYEQSLKNYLVEFCLWHLDSLKNEEQHKVLRNKLKTFFSQKCFVNNNSEFYSSSLEDKFRELMENNDKKKFLSYHRTSIHNIIKFCGINIKWKV